MLEVEKCFRRLLQFPPAHTVRVPGAIELLGGGAAFSRGLALGVALDKTVDLALSARSDGRVFLAWAGQPAPHEFWISDLTPDGAPEWAVGIKRTLALLRKRGVHFSGFNAVFASVLPRSPGLGACAASMVAIVMGVRELHPFRLTDTGVMRPPQRDSRGRLPRLSSKEKLSVARLCRESGAHLGPFEDLLHFVTPLFGKPFHAVALDHLHEAVTVLPAPGIAALVLVPCHGVAERDAAEALRIRERIETAARCLSLRTLRNADQAYLRANHRRLDDDAYRCAAHAIGETLRVIAAEQALEDNDVSLLGRQMDESHESLRDFLNVSAPEVELLMRTARQQNGHVGGRLVGPGFGAWTVHLVLMTSVNEFVAALTRAQFDHTGRVSNPIVSQIGGLLF